MRRRLVLLSLATTTLVVVSFVVPLGLLIRRQAADRAKVGAETDAQAVASLVALAIGVGDDSDQVPGAVGDLPEGTIVVFDDGSSVGDAATGQGSLALSARVTSATASGPVAGGWEVALPVVGGAGVVVVDSFVSDTELTQGVVGAWGLLGLLGLTLIGGASWLADRMGRTLVKPMEDLAESALRLAEGDLDVRVHPEGAEEIEEVGQSFNYMAGRLTLLLAEERENVADLSHRLRTPLTSLRLQAESLADPEERAAMLGQLDRMERAVDEMIELARSEGSKVPGHCDLRSVVSARLAFWGVLAREQARPVVSNNLQETGEVARSASDVAAVVDVLIDNVFSHTPSGTGFEVATGREGERVWLEVSDDGTGFDAPALVGRGVSGRGSSGLGLDIARKTAGWLEVHNRPGGGAVVRVSFGESV